MKKVFITESQLKHVVMQEQYENFLVQQLNESLDFNVLKKKIKRALLAGVTASVILGAVSKLDINDVEKRQLEQMVNTEMVQDSTETQNDSIHQQKIEACRAYMEWAMKNQGYDWSTTNLTPEAIVDICEENNFSIPFTMAIANLESCFGQTPRSKRTNSVFSVGSYDNGKNVCTYSTPDESIAPFINLIKKDYLQNGEKTIDDLLAANQFVNMNGHRYAKNPKYEGQIKSIMNRIIKMYPILNT
jgi:hypothetical protein